MDCPLPWGTLCGSGKTVGSIRWGGEDAGRCELSPVGVNRSLAKGIGCASRDLEIGTESLELVAYKVYTRISQTVNSVRIVSSDLKYSDKAKIRVVSQRFGISTPQPRLEMKGIARLSYVFF